MLVILPSLLAYEAFHIQLPVGDDSCLAASSISASAPWPLAVVAVDQSVVAGGKPSLAAAEGSSWSEKDKRQGMTCIKNAEIV